MPKNVLAIIISLLGVVVVGAVVWYLAAPLFIDNVVEEDFPIAIPSAEEIEKMSDEEKAQAEADMMEAAADMPDKEMDDPMPEEGPTALTQGQFVGADSFHEGSGSATIYQLADGSNLLRFEDFESTNGPALHVLLATSAKPTSSDDIGDYIDLGPLKGNIGSQNYEIPAGTDLEQYQSVVIYCMPFHVVFSTATLQ